MLMCLLLGFGMREGGGEGGGEVGAAGYSGKSVGWKVAVEGHGEAL